jgi:uncharacterized protein (DUF1778 family)
MYGILPYKEVSMSTRTERLEVRLDPEHKQLIERAAAASGQVVSQFVVPLLVRRAESALRRHERTVLAEKDRDAFFSILDGDEPPTPAMKAAAKRYVKKGKS